MGKTILSKGGGGGEEPSLSEKMGKMRRDIHHQLAAEGHHKPTGKRGGPGKTCCKKEVVKVL